MGGRDARLRGRRAWGLVPEGLGGLVVARVDALALVGRYLLGLPFRSISFLFVRRVRAYYAAGNVRRILSRVLFAFPGACVGDPKAPKVKVRWPAGGRPRTFPAPLVGAGCDPSQRAQCTRMPVYTRVPSVRWPNHHRPIGNHYRPCVPDHRGPGRRGSCRRGLADRAERVRRSLRGGRRASRRGRPMRSTAHRCRLSHSETSSNFHPRFLRKKDAAPPKAAASRPGTPPRPDARVGRSRTGRRTPRRSGGRRP